MIQSDESSFINSGRWLTRQNITIAESNSLDDDKVLRVFHTLE